VLHQSVNQHYRFEAMKNREPGMRFFQQRKAGQRCSSVEKCDVRGFIGSPQNFAEDRKFSTDEPDVSRKDALENEVGQKPAKPLGPVLSSS